MKYLSLFSGIGGFELGIQQAYEELCNKSWDESGNKSNAGIPNDNSELLQRVGQYGTTICAGYSEIDKYAIQIYKKHFNHKNYGDITKINAKELPEFDLLVGGFPCQAFSIAGKRKGFNDTRGTLFFDIARICSEKRPKYLVLENVKGLLSHDKGKTFQTIIGVLSDLGYLVEWQVLNSKNFGVPQNRERVFIVGHLGGEPRRKVFPIRRTDNKIDKPDKSVASIRTSGDRGKQKTYLKYEEVQTLSANPMSDNIPRIIQLNKPKHLNIRKLTPTECERLQGFPDGWTEGLSDTQRYKTLGNAVTVNVIKEIVKRII